MTWVWMQSKTHITDTEQRLHILVGADTYGNQTYLAFISEETDGFKAWVPDTRVQPRGKVAEPYHYTHDTLDEAKGYCVAELVNRRLT